MTTAPPRPETVDEHNPDEVIIKGPGWFAIGALGGFFLTLAMAFVLLMGRTATPNYTTEFASEPVGEESGEPGAPVASAFAELTLFGTEFAFDPVDSAIAAGGELTLDNRGSIEHNIEIEGVPGFLIQTGPSSQISGIVEAPEGTYTIFCSIPGHRDAGMVGTLTVTASS